jgi:hypothetical protein
MHRPLRTASLLLTLSIGCSSAEPDRQQSPITEPQSQSCTEALGLFAGANAYADEEHPCHAWVGRTFGRAAQSGEMSAALWSLDTEATTGLAVSAVHTLGEGWFAPAGQAAAMAIVNPAEQFGIARIRFADDEAAEPRATIAPMFPVFNPAIPADQTGDNLTKILPRHDFFVVATDGMLAPQPGPLEAAPPEVDDPDGISRAQPTYADAEPGERVLVLGYPREGELGGKLAAGVGRVLTGDEIAEAMQRLQEAGDEEALIAHDPKVERIILGHAAVGMSGGAAFDADGRLVGILVRASTELESEQYVRLVTMDHVTAEL